MKNTKLYLISFFVLLALLLIFQRCTKKKSQLIFTKETVQVAKGDIDCSVTVNGELVSASSHQVEVPELLFTELALNEIKIRYLAPEGSLVEKGEIIAVIDETALLEFKAKSEKEINDLKSGLEGMTADTALQLKDIKLSVETASLDLQIKELSVDQTLYDPPAVQQRVQLEYKKSQLAYENLLLNLADQRKKLIEKYKTQSDRLLVLEDEARNKRNRYTGLKNIVSPASGVIGYLNSEEASKTTRERILTIQNRIIAYVEDNNNLVSRFFIDEVYYSSVKTGQKIKVHTKSNNIETEAYIGKIDGKIKSVGNSKCFKVEARVNTTEQTLLLNQTTVNTIELSKLKDVLYVPKTAIATENGNSYVFSEEGLKLKVNLREGNNLYAIVDSGLIEGQQIILNVTDELSGIGN